MPRGLSYVCLIGTLSLCSFLFSACKPLAAENGSYRPSAQPGFFQAEGEASRVSGPGEFPIVGDKVTLKVMVMGNELVEDFATNDFTLWYEEYTNVHIEWEVVSPKEVQDKLKLTLAKGDFPDIILNMDVSPVQQTVFGQQGAFLPLNELIERYGIETKNVLKQYPILRDIMTAPDGNIYALPRINENYHYLMPQKMWIYEPWLRELGLDMPTTTAEFHYLLKAFKERDPNGNGLYDEIPMAGNIEDPTSDVGSFLMNAFVFHNRILNPSLYLNEGRVEVDFDKPGYRDGLAYLNRLYEEGLIAPQSFTQDERQLKNLVESDVPIVGVVPSWGIFDFTDISSNSKRYLDYVSIPPLAGPGGLRVTPYNPYPFDRGVFVITSKSKYPEVAFRWADAMYSEEITLRQVHGRPEQEWRWAKLGEPGINGNPAHWKKLIPFGVKQNHHWYQTGPAKQDHRLRSSLASNGEDDPEKILYEETLKNYKPYMQEPERMLPPLIFTELQAVELAELEESITHYVEQMKTRFILGDALIEQDWERYLSTLADLNLARYIEIHQEAYETQYNKEAAHKEEKRQMP